MLSLLGYVIVHDYSRVLNPLIVEGQIHGGVAQGLGGGFWEKLAYDAQGQPLTTSFVNYALPAAADLPSSEAGHEETHTPLNPTGAQGAGLPGVIPVGPA